jgi:ribonucleoside-diphosphate reductase alpha chain
MSKINVLDTQEILSEINIYNKYAKHIPSLSRRENWNEIVDRNKDMQKRKFPNLSQEIDEAYELVYEKKILPSMRSIQFAGKPIEVNPSRIYNCSFMPIDNYKVFGEAMFLLLGGVGLGFSVQKHHVEKLPLIRKPLKTKRFLIGDSIEGWSDAIHHLMKAYLSNGARPNFDFRDIRPKGAKLITAGGKAPGPNPLKICLAKIESILESKKDGDQLSSIECHDIICHIADAVLAGGIRRAACISLFSFDDEEMFKAKYGSWWEENPQRGRANNSVVLLRSAIKKDDFDFLWKKIKDSESGEPGIIFTNDKEMGVNPCCLTGDTQIFTSKGQMPIKKIVEESLDLEVLTKNIKTGKLEFKKIKNKILTKKNASLIKLTLVLNSGKIKELKCTPDHKIYTSNRGWVEARFLTNEDEIEDTEGL